MRLGFNIFLDFFPILLVSYCVGSDPMSSCHTLFSIMYHGFCRVVLNNNKIVSLFYGLEDVSADVSHDQLESELELRTAYTAKRKCT
jgi:hypothetical protein